MNSNRKRALLTTIIIGVIAWSIFHFLFYYREQPLPLSKSPLSFQAAEAHRLTREFVTQFPNRALGSIESRQSTGFIHDYLINLGYSVGYSHFDARIAGRLEVGRNIRAYRQGRNPDLLALVAHFDTAKTTVQGAMDNGSGVGVLLELARVFAANPTNRSILLIFTDGEEYGMLGARDLAENDPDRSRIAAALSLDHVAIGDLGAFCLGETGQFQGFTPPWLRQLTRIAAEAESIPVLEPYGISENLERAILISWADQGPFLAAGIPAINLGSESRNKLLEREIHHSAQDTIEKITAESIEKYGRAAERIVRSLDELPKIPGNRSDALRILDGRYIKTWIVSVLHIISLAPPLLLVFLFLISTRRLQGGMGVVREFVAVLATALPFWIIFLLIKVAVRLRLIPVYTLYPATIKDPVLVHPLWGILASIFGVSLFIALVCFVIFRYSYRERPAPDFRSSKLSLIILLLLGVVLALLYNSYWAFSFLLFPSWIWGMTDIGKSRAARGVRWILILAAGIPYYAVLIFYASRLGMRWNFIWYQALALSSGMFTAPAYFLATIVVAIGIRFLVIQSHKGVGTN